VYGEAMTEKGTQSGSEAESGSSAILGTEEFLFVFVSLAFAVSIREVFPSVYGALESLYHYYQSLPNIGLFHIFQMVFGSRMHFKMVLPYLESVALSFVVFGLWVGYYFLMATVRRNNWIGYAPIYMGVDLVQAVLLYITARSLTNLTAKSVGEPNTVWLGIVGIMIVAMGRLWFAMINIRSEEGEIGLISRNRWVRVLMRVVHINMALLSVAVCGLVYDHAALDLRDVFRAITWGCVAYGIAAGASAILVKRLVYSECRLGRVEIAEALAWAWRKEGRWMAVGVGMSLCIQLAMWLGVWRWGVGLVSLRDVIPVSLLLGVGVLVGGGAVAQWGGTPMIGHVLQKGPKAFVKTTLKQFQEYADCIGETLPTLVVFSVDEGPGGAILVAKVGKLSRASENELTEIAQRVLERATSDPKNAAFRQIMSHKLSVLSDAKFPWVPDGFKVQMAGVVCATNVEAKPLGVLFVIPQLDAQQVIDNTRFRDRIVPISWLLAKELEASKTGT
jgi:hypothetical protein